MTFLHSTKLFMMFFQKKCDFCGFRGVQGRKAHDFGLHLRYQGTGRGGGDAAAIGGIEQGGKFARRPPYPTLTAQRTATVIAAITHRLLPVSAAKEGPRSGSRSGDSHAETIVGHAYRPTRMLVPSDTDASVVRYGSTCRPIRTGDDGQERPNNGQNTCRR